MKRLTKSTDLGFHFTEMEEFFIKVAGYEAAHFMENYGKGAKPYMVDLSHYETNRTTKAKRTAD